MRVVPSLALLLALAVTQACHLEEPFARTNPFDAGGEAVVRMVGPDSVHAIAERFLMVIESTPTLPDGELHIDWNSSSPFVLPTANGEFIVHLASAEYTPIHLSATLHHVVVGQVVHVGQRAATMAPSCAPPSAAASPCDAAPLAPDSNMSVYVPLEDANGWPVNGAEHAMARAGVVSRDAAVAVASIMPGTVERAGVVRVRGVGGGSTWIVLTVDDAIDSVRVEVAP